MQLSIGTAQLGTDYGVTNKDGKVKEEEAYRLLRAAREQSINYIDTAQGYGDAEKVIGASMSKMESCFRVTSKKSTDPEGMNTMERRDRWNRDIEKSLNDLGIDRLDSFMLHNVQELKGDYGQTLIDWLKGIKEKGFTRKIGVSIYDESDLQDLDLKWVDIIQAPISLYDQRLIESGCLRNLKERGIEIHARSIFLQGILLESANLWPDWLGIEAKARHSELENYCEARGISLQEICVAFIRSIVEVDVAVFGICSVLQLDELMSAWSNAERISFVRFDAWRSRLPHVVDPRKWQNK